MAKYKQYHQRLVVSACYALHNFIGINNRRDVLFNMWENVDVDRDDMQTGNSGNSSESSARSNSDTQSLTKPKLYTNPPSLRNDPSFPLYQTQIPNLNNGFSKSSDLFGFDYDLNEFGGFDCDGFESIGLVNTDPIVIEENSGSGSGFGSMSEGANSSNGLLCVNPIVQEVKVKEEVEKQEIATVGEEEKNEIQKLSDELMAYENFMKFYQIPYYDGQSVAPPVTIAAQGNLVDDLWSFDDDEAVGSSVPLPM
ncbi:uncharacterized protein LOC115957044 [Quercus lobata]|nr:uncharacterized protein LOC115957044 [Quercus lobata]